MKGIVPNVANVFFEAFLLKHTEHKKKTYTESTIAIKDSTIAGLSSHSSLLL